MKRQARGGHREPTWQRPGWMAGSCLLHLTLAGALVLLQSAAEAPGSHLRIRLIDEPRTPPPAAAPEPVRKPAPARLTAPPPVKSAVPAHGIEREESPVAHVPPAAPAGPLASSEAGPAGEPAPPRVVERAGETGGGGRAGAEGASGPFAEEAAHPHPGLYLIASAEGGAGGAPGWSGVTGGGHGGNASGPGLSGAGEGGGRSGLVAGLGGGEERGGTGAGVADLLRAIRLRIERAQVYPEAARREGMQGTVELRFRIAGDGSAETIEVVRSSGHKLLDEVSAQTVHRAGPFPRLAGWIRVPFSYRLDR